MVGPACAHALANAGLSALVLDANLGGTTHAGMGHLVVMDDNPAELALSHLSLGYWREWAAVMASQGRATNHPHCGTLWIAADAQEMHAAEQKRLHLHAHEVACELVTARELAALEPVLSTGLYGALRVTGNSMVYAPNAAEWLLNHAGPRIRCETRRVSRIDERTVHCTDGSRWQGGAVLLAAGTHATEFCPELPTRPKKGHFVITDRGSASMQHQLVEPGYVTNAHQNGGYMGGVQFAAASDRAAAARIVARVRYAGPRHSQRGAGAHAAPRDGICAVFGPTQGHPHLDRFLRRHLRRLAHHQPASGARAPVARRRSRGLGRHHRPATARLITAGLLGG